MTKNYVFIAKSLDGYIADKNGGLEWLNSIPNPDQNDMGYNAFMDKIDAIVMGRNTFSVVSEFDMDWPYHKPVFVLSNHLKTIPPKCKGKVELINGSESKILKALEERGFRSLYIDGGITVQAFLAADLIDELIITTLPILLGGGIPLFKELPDKLEFEHIRSEVFLNAIVQDHYKRKR